MDDQSKLLRAKEVFEKICRVFDEREWTYQKDEEHLIVNFGVRGNDLPMEFIMIVSAERQAAQILSQLPFRFSENKRIDGAIATCAASVGLRDGSFDYDIESGTIHFRLTASFIDSYIGEDLLSYMVDFSDTIVDEYNDKFFALEKGYISLEKFIEQY